MQVKLISYTPDALNLLLRSKNTRLANTADDPAQWSDEKKAEHLDYMLTTIRSSWEMISYVFEISGVSRSFTHQLVRTRQGSYAQESQRTVDVSDHEVLTPEFTSIEQRHIWEQTVRSSMHAYSDMIRLGMPVQDARGLLPTNVTTSIMAKYDLRTLSQTALVRMCTRTAGEYQRVFREMRRVVVEVHPWAADFIDVQCIASGTCAFPRYGKKECPVYSPVLDREAAKATMKLAWAAMGDKIHAADPKAKGGMT